MVLLMGFISQLVERLVRRSACTMDFFYILCLLKLLWNFVEHICVLMSVCIPLVLWLLLLLFFGASAFPRCQTFLILSSALISLIQQNSSTFFESLSLCSLFFKSHSYSALSLLQHSYPQLHVFENHCGHILKRGYPPSLFR